MSVAESSDWRPLTGCSSDRLTPAQSLNLQNISDLHFSPDGQLVAFVVTEPVKGTTRARHIWLLDVKTKTVRQFTNSVKTEDSPRWSPDGKRLAFLEPQSRPGLVIQVVAVRNDGVQSVVSAAHFEDDEDRVLAGIGRASRRRQE